MTSDSIAIKVRGTGYPASIVVGIVGAIVSAVLLILVGRWTADIAALDFNDTAGDREADIQSGIAGYFKSLVVVQSLLETDDMDISQAKFSHITDDMRRTNPGALDFALQPRVNKADRAVFEARIRALGQDNFQIKERDATGGLVKAGERDDYFPILTESASAANGYDIASDSITRQLLAQARDNDIIVSAPPRKLIVGGSGFISWAPVYRFESADKTQEDRRKNLIGYTSVTIRISDMIESILRSSAESAVDIYIADPVAAPDNRFIYWDPWKGRPAPTAIPVEAALLAGTHWQGNITVANQKWEIIITPAIPLGGGVWGWQALSACAVSLIMTIMIVSYLFVSRRRTQQLEFLASNLHQKSEELALESNQHLLANQELMKLDETLLKNQERLTLATESARIGIWDWDIPTNKLTWDDRMYELYGIHAQDFSGAYDAWQAGLYPDDRAWSDAAIKAAIDGVKDFNIEFRVLWPNGEVHDIEARALVRGPVNGRATRMVGINWDITERKRTQGKVAYIARHDPLTDLANRLVFVEALDQEIARSRRDHRFFAVLYLDLDHFKDVNDTLGHPVGDLLLQAVADRLKENVRVIDTVSRFGGDEFAIILTNIGGPTGAAAGPDRIKRGAGEPIALHEAAAIAGGVAEKIINTLADPFLIQGNEIRSAASVGIALYGHDSPDAEKVLSHADVALYRAKSEARGTYQFFNDTMNAEVHQRVTMGTELRQAIALNQLFLMYQPQVAIDTGRIVGVEALVRWHHPTRGTVGAGNFIPGAERNGLIVPLGHWVMREACRQAKQWLDDGIGPPFVSINLSGVQFKRPIELEQDIMAVLAEFELPARTLELELTESVIMKASREHNDLLLRFRKTGYRIAIDDFGSGYSSLDYLRRYPVDRIKIAQSFIADIGVETSGSGAIVRAALGLARELGLDVVVEGVETAAQLDLLKSWGCRTVQGFYFSRPVAAPEMSALLRVGKIIPTPADRAHIAAPA